MNILFIILAIFILGVLIMVHELGHYVAGRLLKFEIFEFAIGMGPKLFTKKKNGIKYSLRAIPFGGYVAFDNEESIEKGELKFHKNPIWKRIIVTLAGPVMNIVTALILVILFVNLVGYPTYHISAYEVSEGSAAYEAGMLAGDEFIEANGKNIVGNTGALQNTIKRSDGEAIEFIVKRNDELIDLTVTPKYSDEQKRYLVGIIINQQIIYEEKNFFESFGSGTKYSFSLIKQLVEFLFVLITRGEGFNDISGPVGSIGIIAEVAQQQSITDFIHMVAFISMNLGVFNLLPFPPLDGSKLVLFGVEGVRKKPLSVEQEGMVQMIGFGLFIVLAVVLTYKDIVRMVTGG